MAYSVLVPFGVVVNELKRTRPVLVMAAVVSTTPFVGTVLSKTPHVAQFPVSSTFERPPADPM